MDVIIEFGGLSKGLVLIAGILISPIYYKIQSIHFYLGLIDQQETESIFEENKVVSSFFWLKWYFFDTFTKIGLKAKSWKFLDEDDFFEMKDKIQSISDFYLEITNYLCEEEAEKATPDDDNFTDYRNRRQSQIADDVSQQEFHE